MTITVNPAVIAQTVAVLTAVGGLLPLATALVQRPSFPDWARVAIGVVFATVGALVAVLADPHLSLSSPADVVVAVVTVVTLAQVAYVAIWKPSGVAPAIELATSPRRHAA